MTPERISSLPPAAKRTGGNAVWKIAAGTGLLLVVMLFPLPVRNMDRDRAVEKAIVALQKERRVFLNGSWGDLSDRCWRYVPFLDASYMRGKSLYYANDTSVNNEVFRRHGIRPAPDSGWDLRFYGQGKALVEITTWDRFNDVNTGTLHFNYYYGSLGAQGYRMRLYRNLLGTFGFFTKEWAS